MADLTIKLPGGNKTISAETTEPNKPYLAQKTGNGALYYPLGTYTSGDGVLIKGNNITYAISEGAFIQMFNGGSLERLTVINVYDANNTLKATYNNPMTRIIEVFGGGKIQFFHDSGHWWYYQPVDKGSVYDIVDIGKGESCFVDVPSNAKGNATLYFSNHAYGQYSDELNYYVSGTTGWIKSANCYPYM